jgi:hypothetical protein
MSGCVGVRLTDNYQELRMELVWVALAGAALWGAYKVGRNMERENAAERVRKKEQGNRDLAIVGPIAVLWAAGRLTDEQADREVKGSSILSNGPFILWRGMTNEEKVALAARMVQLSKDPVWQAQQEKSHQIANKLREELGWSREDFAPKTSAAEPGGANAETS